MSDTPLYPLASPEGSQAADTNWEYLETGVRHYTIDLVNQYRNQCLLAVNNNIINFHPEPTKLDGWLSKLLQTVADAEAALVAIHPKHHGLTGNAMSSNDVARFLAIHEEYVIIQSQLLQVYNDYFVPLFNSNQAAHAAAVAAQQPTQPQGSV